MDLFDKDMRMVYQRVLEAHPGIKVCMFDEHMNQGTEWTTIGGDWKAEWTPEQITVEGIIVTQYLLWDGRDRFRLVSIDMRTRLNKKTDLVLDFWERQNARQS